MKTFRQVDFLVWTFCSNSTWGIHLPYVYPYVFVVPVASFGSVEEQARGSLHMHVVCWTGLPPNLLQAVTVIPVVVESVRHDDKWT